MTTTQTIQIERSGNYFNATIGAFVVTAPVGTKRARMLQADPVVFLGICRTAWTSVHTNMRPVALDERIAEIRAYLETQGITTAGEALCMRVQLANCLR